MSSASSARARESSPTRTEPAAGYRIAGAPGFPGEAVRSAPEQAKSCFMNSIYAIAGIDTGIGKTVVTGLIARHLRASGRDAITVKMVQTGNSGQSEDIAEHRRMCPGAVFREDALGLTAPQIFKYPSSPKLAAELEGRRVDLECISRAVKACSEAHEITLVEMAGGTVDGAGNAVEKAFQGGGDRLRAEGLRIESLARIKAMNDEGEISFC